MSEHTKGMKNKNQAGLSWKAIRRGSIYCSPACGGGCTYAAYQKACRDAAALAKRMGNGWTPRVHENLGWHWCVISPCKRITLRKTGDCYCALFGEAGSMSGQWLCTAKIPKAAVANVIAVAKSELAKIGAFLQGL
jgi:hypothetical protein